MKKHTDKKLKKLGLGRETLAALSPTKLDGVVGGAAVTLTWTCDPTGGYTGGKTL